MRTANPYFDIALWRDNSGASLGQTYIGTLDFDWGPTDWVNVSDWHRYTVSFDQANNVVLLFVDGVMLQNYSNTDPDMSVDFSPEASSTFFLGMYGEWSWGDDDSGQLFFLNDDRFRGQIDEVAFWDRALSPDDVEALAAGDAATRSGVDAALSLDPSLMMGSLRAARRAASSTLKDSRIHQVIHRRNVRSST
jgi:hypothetical protein